MTQGSWRVPRPTFTAEAPQTGDLLETTGDAIPVRILIVQDGVMTGWDDGALGFDADAVWFSGRATSFRIGAGDVLPGKHLLSRREAVTDGEALRQGLPLRHPEREVWVRVEILKTEERKDWEDEARLIREVKRLRALSSGGGESQYPPLAPRPGMIEPERPPHRRLVRYAVVFALLIPGVIFSGQLHGAVALLMNGAGMALVCFGDASSPHDQKALRRIASAEVAPSLEVS